MLAHGSEAMDNIGLSLKLKRLAIWLDSQCQPEDLLQRQFSARPFGNCYVTIDSARQGPFVSSNYNRVHICGAEPGLQADGIERLIELFTTQGVKRFFVWLSPGPDMGVARQWLEEQGLSRVRRTGYPTLVRDTPTPVQFKTDLTIREISADEIVRARDRLGDTMWPEYARSAGKEGFFHYMAFDGDKPVAIAALCIFEDLGYLMTAATEQSHRKRRAQQALIARRIQTAEQIGCSRLVSEALYHLEHSYRNLKRAGFQEAYEKEMFEWTA